MDSKVLILSADYGEGHAQVSNALVSQLKSQGLQNVKVINLMQQSHPWIDTVSRQFYLKSYTNVPAIYGWLYHSTKHLPLESMRARWLHSFGMHKMKELLEKEKPDLLVHTFPGSAAAELKRRGVVNVPIFSVLTDFSFHQRWIHKQIDRYFVATNKLKEEIAEAGEPSEKIVVTGIPIRSSFEVKQTTEQILDKYELSPSKKILLVLAGAYGVSSDVKKMCESLKEESDCQVILICGKNKSLESEMKIRFSQFPHFKIMGYVDTLNELMQVATCLVSKPGGVTISEAIACGLPLVFLPPVSGQEEENAHFLGESGAATVLGRKVPLGKQLIQTLNSSNKLEKMKQNAETLHESGASKQIAEHILNYLQNSSQSNTESNLDSFISTK